MICKGLYKRQEVIPIIPPDCKAMSFALPSRDDEALQLVRKIQLFRFKYQDIIEYEQNTGLCPLEQQNDIAPVVATTAVPLPQEPNAPIFQAKNMSQREESKANIVKDTIINTPGIAQGRTLQDNGATSETPLNGYKEIAKHFGVVVDTVRKSFKNHGCPIHKYNGKVYAYPRELNDWRNSQNKNKKKK